MGVEWKVGSCVLFFGEIKKTVSEGCLHIED
jgi:hypothetical protein